MILVSKNAHFSALSNGTSSKVQNGQKISLKTRKHAGRAGLLRADLLHKPGDLQGGPQPQHIKKGPLCTASTTASMASLGHNRSY